MRYLLKFGLLVVCAGLQTVLVFSSEGISSQEIFLKEGEFYAQFLVDFAEKINTKTLLLCLRNADYNTSLHHFLHSFISRHLVYVSNCESNISPDDFFGCSLYDSFHTVSNAVSRINSCEMWFIKVYITTTARLEQTQKEVQLEYQSFRGYGTFLILGAEISLDVDVLKGTAAWITADYNKTNETIYISEILTFQESTKALRTALGLWNPSSGVQLNWPPGRGPTDFMGQTVILTTFHFPPYYMSNIKKCPRKRFELSNSNGNSCNNSNPKHVLEDGQIIHSGYLIDIIELVAEKLNFTFYKELLFSYKIVSPPEMIFGVGASDNYTGLVGMLWRRKADIILASLIQTRERYQAIDFSTSVDSFSKNLYIRANATTQEISWATYAMSFKWTAWLGILLSLIATSIFYFIIMHYDVEKEETKYSFQDILFFFMGAIFQQGIPNEPRSYKLRIIFFLFWISCLVLYAYYTARLTSFFTISNDRKPFSTIEEAVENVQWSIGVLIGTPSIEHIRDAKEWWYQKLYQQIMFNPSLQVTTEQEALDKIIESNFAFFNEDSNMRYLLNGNCSFQEIPIHDFPRDGHIGYSKNLPFAEILDITLTRASTAGLLSRLRNYWWGNHIPCADRRGYRELSFHHTGTAFLVFAGGLALSVLALALERIKRAKRKNKRTSTDSSDKSQSWVEVVPVTLKKVVEKMLRLQKKMPLGPEQKSKG